MKRERKSTQSKQVSKANEPIKKGGRVTVKKGKLTGQVPVSAKTKILGLFVIVVASIIAYSPGFQNEITSWDDEFYINENPYLDLTKENVQELFKFDTYYMGNYHPIAMVSLSVDYFLGGKDGDGNINPFMFHFTNILLHILVSLFVFWFVYMLLKKFSVAVIAGLLFALHTLHVESVAWISERKDVLYAFFFVASLVAYLKYVDSKKVLFYIISLLLFLLSLFSKGQAVSLAVTILLIDFFRRRKITDLKLIAEKIPFIALAIFFGLIAIGAQKESEALVDEQAYDLVQRMGIAAYAFMQYIFKLILPVKLSAIYPYPDILGKTIPALYYAMIIPVLFFAALFIWSIKKERPVLTFGIAFFTVNIFLLLQFIPVGSAIHADRYAYIPSIGYVIILASIIYGLIEKNQNRKMMIYGLTGAYVLLLGVLTFFRTEIWKDSETLWTDTVNKSPKSVVAWNNLGSFKDKEGSKAADENRFKDSKEFRLEAVKYFTKAVEGKPDYKNAFYNRGISRLELGKLLKDSTFFSLSIKDFDKALEQDAQFADAYHSRGNAKSELGNLESALKDFNLAIDLKPDDANYYTNRGVTKGKLRDLKGAIEDFNTAISINPNESASYSNRGRAKMLGNDIEGAIEDYTTAIELDPKHSTAYFNRALAKQRILDMKGALEDFNKTIQLNPELADAYYFRALIYIDAGKTDEACSDLQQAYNKGMPAAQLLLGQYCQ